MMTKTALLLAVILFSTVFALPAVAYQIPNTNSHYNTNVHTDGLNNDPQAQAEMLKKLGLFSGTDEGFELDRRMTRAEAAAMLVRFLGAEEKALSGTWKHPFIDVPAWADKYVGWLYQSGLTEDVSARQYGAQQNTTLKQYAIFLTRALLGPEAEDDSWKNHGVATEEEVELWDETNGFFNRAAAVGLSIRALMNHYTAYGNWMSMAQFLVDNGVFTAQQFGEASWDVLPSTYGTVTKDGAEYLTRYVADVPVAQCDEAGFFLAGGCADSTLDYLHAWRKMSDGLSVEFLILDPKTLDHRIADSFSFPEWEGADYIGTVNGTDYLIVSYSNSGKGDLRAGALVSWDGQAINLSLDAQELWGDSIPPAVNNVYASTTGVSTLIGYEGYTQSFAADGNLLIVGNEKLFFISKSGIAKNAYTAGTQILYFDGRIAVCQLVKDEEAAIYCLDAATGRVSDKYIIPRNMEDDAEWRAILRWERGCFYGEAGLYKLIDGRLYQLTTRPALALAFTRMGAISSDPIILTHAPGERIYGMNAPIGNMIVMIGEDGSETVLLVNDPPHGIEIAGIYGMGSALWFYSEEGVGMQRANVYTYALEFAEKGTLVHVVDYKAGRPEVEAGWAEDNTTGYKKAYIEKEQARLDALGYGHKS